MTNIIDYYTTHYFTSVLILLLVFAVAFTVAKTSMLRRFYLPVSLVAGAIILLIGPQVMGQINPDWSLDQDFYTTWQPLPGVLINIVFACLFLGNPILKIKKMWRMAGQQIAFGQTVAWGQYLIGGLVTLLLLLPLFGDKPIIAALLEISFEGGHGTVAGLTPMWHDLNFAEGQSMAVGLATLSLITALIAGIFIMNWGRGKGLISREHRLLRGREKHHFYHYTLIHAIQEKADEMKDRHLTLGKVLKQVVLVAISVVVGFGIREVLILVENATWGQAGVHIFSYVPAFSICLFGGLIVNYFCQKRRIHISSTANSMISTLCLGVLIMTAVGTMSLEFFREPNLAASFWILFVSGVIWIVSATLFLARRMFIAHWFTNAIISFGQAMGMTATGLLFAQMADPQQKTGAVEAFGYKQMLFEPLMGGGLVTAMSMPLILLLGLPAWTIICGVIALGWCLAGIFYFSRKSYD
ncbi:MAG: hypothetical protein LBL08_03760 [Candidatus Nomurabacteria bacterium]|nr:hypothetical protein [Candidatus Nomurabacteria bacterium]